MHGLVSLYQWLWLSFTTVRWWLLLDVIVILILLAIGRWRWLGRLAIILGAAVGGFELITLAAQAAYGTVFYRLLYALILPWWLALAALMTLLRWSALWRRLALIVAFGLAVLIGIDGVIVAARHQDGTAAWTALAQADVPFFLPARPIAGTTLVSQTADNPGGNPRLHLVYRDTKTGGTIDLYEFNKSIATGVAANCTTGQLDHCLQLGATISGKQVIAIQRSADEGTRQMFTDFGNTRIELMSSRPLPNDNWVSYFNSFRPAPVDAIRLTR